ncbi:hypothetical protein HYW35_01260 [Candidatus Saccharibacteria bacterium]|nr:hypothetical protein [Candidatus Saccharibacteria bacterium]
MFYVFLAISLVFIASLVFKSLIKKSFCSLCVAVASTWLALLVLYKIGRFGNQVLLGLLIGQSITGIFYFAYQRLPKSLRIFSLPFFLSLTAILYTLITSEVQLSVFILLTILWLAAWVIFTYRNDPGKKGIARILAKCCEDI